MNNILDEFITILSPGAALKRKRARMACESLDRISKRLYEGASHGIRSDQWIAPQTSANTENIQGAQTLRARSRDLIRNNPYAARAVRIWTSNAIGHGIIPQIKCEDEKKREKIERTFEEWAETTDCDLEGRKNLYEIQSLVLASVIESGEVLVRICSRSTYERPNFQLQILEIDHLDSNRFSAKEHTFTQSGIEFSKKTGARIGYWLFPEHPGESYQFPSASAGFQSFYIKAPELLHIYRQDRPGQNSGIPWSASIMTRLKDFDGFEDAQLRRQLISSSYAGFLEDSEPPIEVKLERDGTQTSKIVPGTIAYCPPGKRIIFNNPPDAGANYSAYSSQILHAISIGYGIPYEALTGDFSQVNFSSGRMGYLEFQRQLDHVRFNMFIPQFCVPIWNQFKRYLTLKGIAMDDVTVSWVPPRREMIDPVSETKAMTQAIRSGLITLSDAVTQMGVDPMDHYKELSQINEVLDEYGLKLDSDARHLNQVGANQIAQTQNNQKQENYASDHPNTCLL
jgi:lambda family phage portal protein